jgi:single-stranded-DNA-specific exonuclease
MADAGEQGFLGVTLSLLGKRWLERPADDRLALALAQRLDLPEIVGRVLASRGVGFDDAPGFLDPKIRDGLPDPSHLKDMDAGADRLARAVMGGERIAVFADYDVDGATSAALLSRFLGAVGSPPLIYVPDRRREGYGPSAEAFEHLREEGAAVAVCVDCGTTAHEPLRAAASAGLDVIVVDHHEGEAGLPKAVAVINPNRLDEESPHRQLAAVGVTFLLVVALNRALRQAGWYDTRAEPCLMQWLDLVALGTVCDVVPLTGVNRALVAQGLAVMGRRGNPGLTALADGAAMKEAPGAYHAGFVLGPRINAGGRIGEAGLGARLLATDDAAEARAIAQHLDGLNRERQAVEAAVLDAAAGIAADAAPDAALVLAAGDGWHPGVIGIVAGRLKERFNRPALVVSFDGEVGTGSGRSIPGANLGAAVIAARQAGLLVKGGGHAMAAGFTVERSRLGELEDFLAQRLAAAMDPDALVPRLRLDGAIRTSGATRELVRALERVAPFGAGNPEPRLAVSGARIVRADVVGGDHVRCILSGEDGGRLKAIAFRVLDGALGPALLEHGGAPFHFAGRLRRDTWQGRDDVQLLIDDASRAW